MPAPNLSLGPHLSYALQWWLLTAVAAPLGIWVTRRDALHERERQAADAGAAAPPTRAKSSQASKPGRAVKPAKKPRAPSDEEIEDAL